MYYHPSRMQVHLFYYLLIIQILAKLRFANGILNSCIA